MRNRKLRQTNWFVKEIQKIIKEITPLKAPCVKSFTGGVNFQRLDSFNVV